MEPAVCLYIGRGECWYSSPRSPAAVSLGNAAALPFREGFREVVSDTPVRVLATRKHASLICDLMELNDDVWLGSPVALPAKTLRRTPAEILIAMQNLPKGDAVAATWHRIGNSDRCTYGLIAALKANNADAAQRWLRRHPAWAALGFVRTVDPLAAAKLVADIADPRWYAHPTRPGRLTRLFSRLGLHQSNIAACLQVGQKGYRFREAANAVLVWYNRRGGEVTDAPGDFLLRHAASYGSEAAGLLRTTQRLIRFVYYVWLQSADGLREDLFAPTRYFDNPREAAAYVEFAASLASEDR